MIYAHAQPTINSYQRFSFSNRNKKVKILLDYILTNAPEKQPRLVQSR